MQILKDRIRKDGKIKEGNVLKVDSFLNHQMDIHLFEEIGKEFKRRFEGERINKILTIEASGIGIACLTAHFWRSCSFREEKPDQEYRGRRVHHQGGIFHPWQSL